jgi:hypothetical protein
MSRNGCGFLLTCHRDTTVGSTRVSCTAGKYKVEPGEIRERQAQSHFLVVVAMSLSTARVVFTNRSIPAYCTSPVEILQECLSYGLTHSSGRNAILCSSRLKIVSISIKILHVPTIDHNSVNPNVWTVGAEA